MQYHALQAWNFWPTPSQVSRKSRAFRKTFTMRLRVLWSLIKSLNTFHNVVKQHANTVHTRNRFWDTFLRPTTQDTLKVQGDVAAQQVHTQSRHWSNTTTLCGNHWRSLLKSIKTKNLIWVPSTTYIEAGLYLAPTQTKTAARPSFPQHYKEHLTTLTSAPLLPKYSNLIPSSFLTQQPMQPLNSVQTHKKKTIT